MPSKMCQGVAKLSSELQGGLWCHKDRLKDFFRGNHNLNNQ